jgi:hypothetical protein
MARTGLWSTFLLSLLTSGMAAAQPAREIPRLGPQQDVPAFVGRSATEHPLDALAAADPGANGTSAAGGPLGGPEQVGTAFLDAACGPVTFDRKGRAIAACSGGGQSALHLFHPTSLKSLAVLPLPPRTGAGGIHLDAADRVVIPTGDRQVWTVRQVQVVTIGQVRTSGSVEFEKVAACDLSAVLPAGSRVVSAVPGDDGLLWFAASSGQVGTLRQEGCAIRTLRLTTPDGAPEGVTRPVAIEPGQRSAFVVSDHALYRLEADGGGQPQIAWRQGYDRGIRQKPGKADAGAGTGPVLIGAQLVAITDNADPFEHLLVFQRSRTAGGALVCSARPFDSLPMHNAGQGALSGFAWKDGQRASVLVSNRFGYRGPASNARGRTGFPGLSRIDIDIPRRICRPVWANEQISIPSGSVRLSLGNGLVYAYGKPQGPAAADSWYLTAVDFRTGDTVFRRLAGTGIGYADDRAGVALSPDGTAFIGVAGGLVRIGDQGR